MCSVALGELAGRHTEPAGPSARCPPVQPLLPHAGSLQCARSFAPLLLIRGSLLCADASLLRTERVRKGNAALGAAIFLALFLYSFWRVGKLWPGVPAPTDGIFRLKQVLVDPAHLEGPSGDTLHHCAAQGCLSPHVWQGLLSAIHTWSL